MKKIVNNSMVGASKLMHFLNPDKYPMWDSNICEYLNYREQSVEDYISYQQDCDELINSPEYPEIRHSFLRIYPEEAKGDYSDYRSIEQCLRLLASRRSGVRK